LSVAQMQHANVSRAVPLSVGVLVLVVGALQLTAWKARRLICCSQTPGPDHLLPANTVTAWRHGLFLGLRCGYCCFNLMLILLVMGVMDLRLMAIVTLAINAERLAPNGVQIARAVGWLIVAAGLFLVARAVGMS
ncbi:MAG TPA: DUF2182 domain-containing protein, partial [Capsulimonadaceae bacterium]|nr:DUF2182 domain-containing protein [Capsulimonadaceae bacterium]